MFRSVKRLGLLALGLSLLSASSHATTPSNDVTRRIVVFAPGTTPAQRLAIARQSGGTIVRELPMINAVVVETPSERISVANATLASHAEVARVDEDPKINWLQAVDAPGVDFAPSLPAALAPGAALKDLAAAPAAAASTPWGVVRVEAPQAWAASKGAGVSVCVIDTGIDRTHPDLKANIKGGTNIIAKTDDFTDDNGHGSHVSGTIAGTGATGGIIGVAPKASLYGVKVLDASGSGTYDDVIAGMQWAVDNHMQVASMSLGGDSGNQALQDAVAALVKGGVTLVAAAGNSGGAVGFPGAYPGAIAVAASDNTDSLASFSSRGPEVAVIAPGVNIPSTYMKGGFQTLSGTSMATPHVSGLAALYIATHPGSTPDQVRAALAAAAVKLPNVIPEGQGAGLPLAPSLVH
jgi:subtilisin family serine protease